MGVLDTVAEMSDGKQCVCALQGFSSHIILISYDLIFYFFVYLYLVGVVTFLH